MRLLNVPFSFLLRAATLVTLACAFSAVAARPAEAATGYWYPISTPLPTTFHCGPTSQAPTSVFHQACLDVTPSRMRVAFILRNNTKSSQWISTVHLGLYKMASSQWAGEGFTLCSSSWIGSGQLRYCYGDWFSYSYGLYRAEGILTMEGTTVSPDYSIYQH